MQDVKNIDFEEVINLYEEVISWINDQKVFLPDYRGTPRQLELALCSKIAYDYIQNKECESIEFINHSYKDSLDYCLKDEFQLERAKTNPPSFLSSIFKYETGSQARYAYHRYIWDKLGEETLQDTPTIEELNTIKEKFRDVENFIIFQFNLSEFTIEFKPVHGATQDYENFSGKEYAEMVKFVSQKTDEFISNYSLLSGC